VPTTLVGRHAIPQEAFGLVLAVLSEAHTGPEQVLSTSENQVRDTHGAHAWGHWTIEPARQQSNAFDAALFEVQTQEAHRGIDLCGH
jgi:hypothetical protein